MNFLQHWTKFKEQAKTHPKWMISLDSAKAGVGPLISHRPRPLSQSCSREVLILMISSRACLVIATLLPHLPLLQNGLIESSKFLHLLTQKEPIGHRFLASTCIRMEFSKQFGSIITSQFSTKMLNL